MIRTNAELAAAAQNAAKNFTTLYVRGCFGAPMNENNQKCYTTNLSFNMQQNRRDKILSASSETFGFDCVCFIKGLLWGWVGDSDHPYGGANYQSNGVPDKNSDTIIALCQQVSEDFSNLQVGEYLWIKGHCGVYIGNGLAAECTHRWADGVQITRVHNVLPDDGTPGRSWSKHGKLPWITYETEVNQDYSITLGLMRRGDRGERIRALQILLGGRGCNGNMHTPDGIFGPNTEGAVKLYQREMGLTVDGVVGQQTMKALMGV